MVEAYQFKTQQALCNHLGISKSTLATRYMRDSFPAEWVIQCALETGTSLNWLTTGHGSKQTSGNTNTMEVAKYVLSDGALREDGFYILIRDFYPLRLKNLLSSQITILNLFVIKNLMIYVMVNG